MAKLILLFFGLIFFVLGIIFSLLPMLPFGVPFLALSLVCLIPVSTRIRDGIKAARARWAFVNKLVHAATRFTPKSYQRVLRQTDPAGF